MRRLYDTSINDYDLLFYAPLMTDGNEQVMGITPTIQSSVQFGDTKGALITHRSNATPDIKWVIPQAQLSKFFEYTEFLSTAEINYSNHYGYVIYGIDSWLTYNGKTRPACRYGNSQSAMINGILGIPTNTSSIIYNEITQHSNSYTQVVSNNYNEQVVSLTYNGYPTNQRNWVYIGNIGGGSFTGYVKNLKIYGKRNS